ncbi:unnamed protein product [Acanthoscelides obtectus]|uniref:Uncharacterized protein n=1 Tax=Acanthoscelides obtectus TaxID=200917 RepID=A0A9P0Q4P6_ACAOB|nr:unnamed protein product [Acanthoscelides obtectus]CAK1688848.1 hypothetical protein AOBTE_LOCUS36921 [Acanthoscelides obtectus]
MLVDRVKCFSSQISINFIFKNLRIQFLYTVWQQVIKNYPIIVCAVPDGLETAMRY